MAIDCASRDGYVGLAQSSKCCDGRWVWYRLGSRKASSVDRGSATVPIDRSNRQGSAKEKRVDGRMDGWTDGRMDEWMDGWMDG